MKKTCKCTVFHEKKVNLKKKSFFIKVPQMAKSVNCYFPFPRWKQKVGAFK